MFRWLEMRRRSTSEWQGTTSCIVASLVTIAMVTPYGLLGSYLLRHPELAPYMNAGFLAGVALPFVQIYLVICVGILVAALALRRRAPNCRSLSVDRRMRAQTNESRQAAL